MLAFSSIRNLFYLTCVSGSLCSTNLTLTPCLCWSKPVLGKIIDQDRFNDHYELSSVENLSQYWVNCTSLPPGVMSRNWPYLWVSVWPQTAIIFPHLWLWFMVVATRKNLFGLDKQQWDPSETLLRAHPPMTTQASLHACIDKTSNSHCITGQSCGSDVGNTLRTGTCEAIPNVTNHSVWSIIKGPDWDRVTSVATGKRDK